MKKLLIITVILLAWPTSAGAKGKTFTVGESAVKWTSPERYARNEIVTVRFRYRGRELANATVVQNCVIDYTGYGLYVRLWACDNGSRRSPLRVRIASVREDTARVKMTYWR